jgi:membrane-associated protein
VLFNHFTDLVSQASGWAYGIVFALSALDAIVPIVPSETSVITAGVVASAGDLSIWLVILSAACGAFLGDNTAYFLGRRYGAWIKRRFFSSEKGAKRVDWAEEQLTERGGELIGVARFIPGGRTAVTLSAGTLEYPWHRFAMFDAAASLGWALYASLLGYVGGQAFENAPWKGLILALVIAFSIAGGVELVRWWLKRRRAGRRRDTEPEPEG